MNILEISEYIKKHIIISKFLKKFWIWKNLGIIIDLDIFGNNIVISSVPNFKTNSLKVYFYSRNIPDSLSSFESKNLVKDEKNRFVIFDGSLENINQAIHIVNQYIYDVQIELMDNNSKSYDSILVKQKDGSTATILAFSSVGTKKGSFIFYKTFENIDANVVFINDYKSHWYTNGTPDFFNEYEFEKYIRDILLKLGTKELFTFGSSMGGYGAMKYGSVFEADGVIAMTPEVELAIPLSKSILKVPNLQGSGDLCRLKFKNPKKVYLFSGNSDFVDYYSSIKLKENNPEFSVTILNNMPHIIAATIHEKVDLSRLAKDLFFENNKSVLAQIGHDRLLDYQTVLDIKTFREKVRLEKITDLSYKKSLIKTAFEFPEWSLMQYYLSLIYKEEKNQEKQEEYLVRTLECENNHFTARFELANLYFEQDKLHNALENLLILKEHKFSFSCGELLYKILVKLEKIDEAKNVLKDMGKLDLNDKQKKVLDSYLYV